MNTHWRKKLWIALLAAVVPFFAIHARGALTNYTYTGAAPDPGNWHNETNWVTGGVTNGYPTQVANAETLAVIPDGKSPVFTSGAVNNLYRLQTGNGPVVFSSGGLSCHNASPYGPSITIGSGGVTVTGNVWTSRGSFTANGNVRIDGTLSLWQNNLVQNAGTFDITGNISLPDQSASTIQGWVFATPYNGTFLHGSIVNGQTYTWSGTPNFAGGRPDYSFIQGGDSGGATWNLGAQTLLGDVLTLGNWPGAPTRHGKILVNGGVIDVNTFTISYNGAGWTVFNYISITNGTVTIRGSGTAWNNQTEGNTNFSTRVNTTVTFDPTGGVCNVDTGSKDRNSVLLDPVDWENNFAFDQVVLGAGDTITLVGTANIEGGGNAALYATRITGLGGGATLNLNGHNVYLLKQPNNVTFDTAGGGRVYYPKSGTVITIR